MPGRVRKQVYLDAHQERSLKRLASKRGVTEAEIIRKALDLHLHGLQFTEPSPDPWKEERAFIRKWMHKGVVPGRRKWKREDLYDR